ncbi:hypothetical protein NA78x_002881 [Anatilimnocola sp. NA78]|uniref:hypothetical protein n=1 Tax=Anatilimnocola sp. NA78 TaxID=3415683 RepID=UPI003CE54A34
MMTFATRRVFIAAIAAVTIAITGLANAQQPVHEHKHDHTSVLTVRAMQDARYVSQELLKVPGVGRVVPNYKAQTLTIVPVNNAFPSPRMIWDAAERAKIQPARLATAHGNFNARPLR